jgi:hypothetical protein
MLCQATRRIFTLQYGCRREFFQRPQTPVFLPYSPYFMIILPFALLLIFSSLLDLALLFINASTFFVLFASNCDYLFVCQTGSLLSYWNATSRQQLEPSDVRTMLDEL